ncbi:hypothetical protein ANO14919_070690 [Xylariales sp. No.14919]|nr:hypothetical protein ANO14919_070690 [Xylariales sp. No.14919]
MAYDDVRQMVDKETKLIEANLEPQRETSDNGNTTERRIDLCVHFIQKKIEQCGSAKEFLFTYKYGED